MNKKGISTIASVIVVIVVIAIVASVGAWYMMGGEEEEPINGGPTNGNGDGSVTPEAPDTIKIGVLAAMSGELGSQGQRTNILLGEIKDNINSKGGIYLSKYDAKVPVELKIVDFESEVARATELTSKLCSDYKVDVIISSVPPYVAAPVCNICEKNGMPIIVNCPIDPWIGATEEGWKWSWNTHFRVPQQLKALLEGTNMFRGRTNEKVGLFLPDDMGGHAYHDPTLQTLEKANYDVVDLGFYQPGTKDYTSYISEMKNKNLQILWGTIGPADAATLLRQMKEQNYCPKIIFASGGLLEEEAVKAVGGGLANGVLTEVWWSPKYPYPGNDWIMKTWNKVAPEMSISMGLGYVMADMVIIRDALERSGSLDSEAINEAIGNTEIEGPAGPIKFNPETHASPGVITLGQWQKTGEEWELEIVWSPKSEIPTISREEIIFPFHF